MTVAFIAGSLEPGLDGVGDYTRLLASAAAARGVACRIVALADRHAVGVAHGYDAGVETMRLSDRLPWRDRIDRATQFLHATEPAWVSLQFVPYSFHPRGFASALVDAIPKLVGRARLHVMLHEIWIDGSLSWRTRVISAAQRRTVLRLCRHPSAVIQTSNGTYQAELSGHGIEAAVLPLFGSVPPAEPSAVRWLSAALERGGCDALSRDRDEWWLFVLFGTLHPVWPPYPLLNELERAAHEAGRRIALISVGRIGAGEGLWREMTAAHGGQVSLIRLGEQPAERIADVLRAADFGIATSPLALIGKSATATAMLEHGLPLIVNREDCCWPAGRPIDARERALVIRMGPGFSDRLQCARRLPAVWRVGQVAEAWLGTLGAAAVVRP